MYGYVYETINLINNKKYIGQHKAEQFDNKYKGSGKILIKAIEKYGWDNFETKIIEKCNSEEDLNEREKYWIDFYDAVKSRNYYNILPGGFKESTDILIKCRRDKYNGDAAPWFHTEKSNANRLKVIQEKYGRNTVWDNSDPSVIEKQINSRREKYSDPAFNVRSRESIQKSIETRRINYGSCTKFMNTPEAQENKRRTQAHIFEFDNKKFVGLGELSDYIRSTYFPTISYSSVQRIAVHGFISKKYKSICNGKIKIIKEPNIDPRKL